MPKFQVGVGRKTTDYLDVVVEADDRESAIAAALDVANGNIDKAAWQPGDSDYYETTVEEAAADAQLGIFLDPEDDPIRLFWSHDQALDALVDEQMTGPAPAQIVLTEQGTLVLTGGDRTMFATVAAANGQFVVAVTTDPMNLLDPDGTLDLKSVHDTVKDAFAAACEIVGLEYTADETPAP